jgi:hypothetical protein
MSKLKERGEILPSFFSPNISKNMSLIEDR